jgi:hypothetical protein
MSFLEGEICVINHHAKTGLPSRTGEICTIEECLYNSLNYDYLVRFEDNETAKVKESELSLSRLTDEQKELIEYVKLGNHVVYTPTNEVVLILKTDFLHKVAEVEFENAGIQVVRIGTLKKIEKEIDILPKFKTGDIVIINTNDKWNGLVGTIDYQDAHDIYWVLVNGDTYSFKESELTLNNKTKQPTQEKQGKFTEIALEIGRFTDKKNKQYGSSVDATHEMIKVLMERYTYDEENYLMPKSLLQHLLLTVRVMDKQNRIFNNPSGEGDSESPWTDITGYGLIGIDMVATK